MLEKTYSVNHSLFIATHKKLLGSNGTWEETWYWDIYITEIDGYGMIRCECSSNGRNVVIPWFQTKEINLTEVAKKACREKMEEIV